MTTPQHVPGWDDWQGAAPESRRPFLTAVALAALVVVCVGALSAARAWWS